MPSENAEIVRARPGRRGAMPFRAWALLVILAAIAASALSPFDRRDWLLEHLPTVATLAFFVWYERRPGGAPLSNLAYALVGTLLLLHVIGAHFLYSRVPYHEWWAQLAGGAAHPDPARNHYDRFVHLCFGLFGLVPITEIVHRHVTRSKGWAVVVGIAFVAVLSKLYELAEWVIAIVMSPEAAENYNGQQGDVFDAQKDMGLALLGSLAGAGFVLRWMRRGGHRDAVAER